MSSNPAVSIYAQLQLKPGRLQEQAKEEIKALQSSLSGSKFTAISLNFDIPNDLQQRLQAKLNAIKINPINVPVNFIPTGMGGGGGGGGSFAGTNKYQQDTHDFEMFQAQNAIHGEQDNNDFQMYLARMGRGGSGSGGGNGIRSSSVVRMSMGNRIQHRNSSLYNPFSPRGLARMAGGAAGVYGGLMAVNAATGMIDAAETASHPERIMREFDRVGQRHDVQSDSMMQGQAGQLAGIEGKKKVLETLESVPLIGTLGHFIDALTGATKGLQDQEYAVRRGIEIHQQVLKTNDETKMSLAALTNDPVQILAAQQDADDEKAATTRRQAERERDLAGKAIGSWGPWTHDSTYERFETADKTLKQTNSADDARRGAADAKKERVDQIQKLEHDLSPASILATQESTASTQAKMAAGPREAMIQAHASAQLKLQRSIDQKLKDPNRNPAFDEDIRKQGQADTNDLIAKQISESATRQQNEKLAIQGLGSESNVIGLRMSGKTDEAERAALKEKQDEHMTRLNGPGGNKDTAAAYADTAQKEREELDQKIKLARTKEAGDSTAKLAEIKGSADEKMLSAEGHTSDALMESTKRTGDARVAALKREADSTVDAQKKTELLAEARATEAANVKELAAITKEQARTAALDLRKSGESLGAATMGSLGNQFGASQKRISDSYQEKVDAIKLKGGAGMEDDLASAKNERDEANLGLKAQRYASNTAMAIQGQDAAARSHGQEGVGGVLSFADELRKKYQDAGGDKAQAKLVDDYRDSEVAARKRELRPKDAGMKYGGAEYHDVLQQQINTGYGHGEAMKKLMAISGMDVSNAGTPEGMAKESAKNLSDAAKELKDAAGMFNRKQRV